jgi:large subunit ribosomal protein L13Ae
MFQKLIVVDAKDHLMGRLAATVAKEILNGQRVVVVRCEQLNITGSLYRNKLKFDDFLLKRFSTNPTRGHFHERAPSKIFRRSVRGMIPYKTIRGAKALDLLEVYEGVPEKYETKKKWVVQQALRVVNVQSHRKYCKLADLCSRVGWKYGPVVEKLEKRRLTNAGTWHNKRVAQKNLLNQARKEVVTKNTGNVKAINEKLAKLGY